MRHYDSHTCLVRVDILSRDLLLLLYLAREMGLALLQHLKLRPEVENDFLWRIFPLLRGTTAKPAPDA